MGYRKSTFFNLGDFHDIRQLACEASEISRQLQSCVADQHYNEDGGGGGGGGTRKVNKAVHV